eukprot:7448431-Pyramimonas_sp.AAC.1
MANIDSIMGCWWKEDAQVCRHYVCVLPGQELDRLMLLKSPPDRLEKGTGWWSNDRAYARLWHA